MVKKILTLVSITALTGIVSAAGAVGCSSEDEATPTTDGGGSKDGGKKDSGGTDPDPDTDAGNGGCYDENGANVLNEKVTAKFPGGACTAQEVKDVVADCFGKDGTEESCKAFQTDHANCMTCVVGPSESKPSFDIPAFLPLENSGLIAVNACLAVALGKPECALPLTNAIYCGYTACETCEDADQDACFEQATTEGVCSQIEISEACAAVAQTEDEAALAKCTGADSLKTLEATINTLCNVGAGGDGG